MLSLTGEGGRRRGGEGGNAIDDQEGSPKKRKVQLVAPSFIFAI